MTSTKILFTSQELTEFQKLYSEFLGEDLNDDEVIQEALDFVSMLYALSKGEALDVRYNNTALITSSTNSLKL